MVIYHYGHYGSGTDVGPWLAQTTEFGFLGVQLFFMISGFVILWTAVNKSALEFIVSRVSRLYPTFWVCVLLTAATRFALDYSVTISQLLANLTMLPGALRQMPLDDVYWTLVIEIKFYAIILCLLLAGQLPSIRRWLAFWLAISVLAAIYPRWLHMAAFDQFSAYFIAGCYLYLLRTQFSAGLLIPFAICAALGVYNAIAIQSRFTHDDSPQAALWVGIIMIAAYAAFSSPPLRRIRPPSAFTLGLARRHDLSALSMSCRHGRQSRHAVSQGGSRAICNHDGGRAPTCGNLGGHNRAQRLRGAESPASPLD